MIKQKVDSSIILWNLRSVMLRELRITGFLIGGHQPQIDLTPNNQCFLVLAIEIDLPHTHLATHLFFQIHFNTGFLGGR